MRVVRIYWGPPSFGGSAYICTGAQHRDAFAMRSITELVRACVLGGLSLLDDSGRWGYLSDMLRDGQAVLLIGPPPLD